MDQENPSSATAGQDAHRNTAAWYPLAILTAIYATHGLDRMITAILLEPIKHEFGLSDGQAGVISSVAYSIGLAVAGLPMGMLIDRVNRRNLLATLALLWSAATAICGLASNYASLAAARVLVGAAQSGGASTPLSMIGDLFPIARRSTAIGVFYFAGPFGVGVSFLVAGHIAAQFGWRPTVIAAALPGIIFAVLLLTTVREPRRGAFDDTTTANTTTTPKQPAASFPEALRLIRRSPILFNFITATVIATIVQTAFANWQVSFLIREYGFTISGAGSIVALALIFGAAGSALGGMTADIVAKGAIPRLILFATVAVMAGAAMGAAAMLSHTSLISCIFLILYAFFSNAYYGAGMGVIVSLSGVRARGAILGIFLVLMNVVGFGAGPWIAGLLSDLYGGDHSLREALLTLPVLNLVALGFFIRAARIAAATDHKV